MSGEQASEAPSTIFVVGAGRSGTTLLRLILDAHSNVHAGPEDQLAWLHLARWHRIDPSPQRLLLEIERFQTASGPLLEVWGLRGRRESLRSRVQEAAGVKRIDLDRAFEAVRREVLEAAGGASIWCVKTPLYALSPWVVRSVAPDAAVIHLVRDGRDTARSYLDGPLRQHLRPPTLARAAAFWRHCNRSARRFETFGARYLLLRYEDLVAEPQSCISGLCQRLGLSFEPAMAEPQRGNRGLRKISPREHEWHQRTAAPIDASSVGRGRAAMTAEEIRDFDRIAGDELVRYGYETAHEKYRPPLGPYDVRESLGTARRWLGRWMRFRLLGVG